VSDTTPSLAAAPACATSEQGFRSGVPSAAPRLGPAPQYLATAQVAELLQVGRLLGVLPESSGIPARD
jgi:hypothetical protein